MWNIALTITLTGLIFYIYYILYPFSNKFQFYVVTLSVFASIISLFITLTKLGLEFYQIKKPFGNSPKVLRFKCKVDLKSNKYCYGKRFPGYCVYYSVRIKKFGRMHCGIKARLERKYFAFGWRPLMLKKKPYFGKDELYSDYNASLTIKDNPSQREMTIRPEVLDQYITPTLCIESYHYFTIKQGEEIYENTPDDDSYHLFIPNIILSKAYSQNLQANKKNKLRVRITVVVLNTAYRPMQEQILHETVSKTFYYRLSK